MKIDYDKPVDTILNLQSEISTQAAEIAALKVRLAEADDSYRTLFNAAHRAIDFVYADNSTTRLGEAKESINLLEKKS